MSTGTFPTGPQNPPPLFMGIGQGAGCSLTVSGELKNKTTLPPDSEHQVDIEFKGTTTCSTGITGNTQAKLIDTFVGNPVLGTGNQTGATGASQSTVTRKESQDGGREVKVVYSGSFTAPGNRTWNGCTSDPDGERIPVPLLFDGRASADDDDDGSLDGGAQAEYSFPCDPNSQQRVSCEMTVTGTFVHPEGWRQPVEPPDEVIASLPCKPMS